MQRLFGGVDSGREAHDALVCGTAAPAANRDGQGVAAGLGRADQRGDQVFAYRAECVDGVLSVARAFGAADRGWEEGRARRTPAADELGPGAGSHEYLLRARGKQNIEIAETISSPGKGNQLVIRALAEPG
jgi:hypothetical protein